MALDVTIRGQALNSQGLTANDTISGTGLNTFGFLWDCFAIWTDASEVHPTTVWGTCPIYPSESVENCV